MDTEALQALLLVVDHGSLAAAASASGVPRSTLRRRIEQLEARMQLTLFVRDASGSTPTPAAHALADRARPVLQQLDGLADDVREELGTEMGTLRVLVPPGLPPEVLRDGMVYLRTVFPGVQTEVEIGGLCNGELPSHVDVGVLFGQPPPEGPYRTRLVTRVPERLVASADWLATHGPPADVAALAAAPVLSWRPAVNGVIALPLVDGGRVEVRPALTCADVHAVRMAARAGAGIAWVPDAALVPGVGVQDLHPVLDGVVLGAAEVRVLIPERVARMPRTRGAVEVIAALEGLLDRA